MLHQGRRGPGSRGLAQLGRRSDRVELGAHTGIRWALQGSKVEIAVGRNLQACTGAQQQGSAARIQT
jgi:hypothetical protein